MTGRSECSACRRQFYSAEGFDLHRGIRSHRREDGQDAGRCLAPSSLGLTFNARTGDWMTKDDQAMDQRIRVMQAARQAGGAG